MSHTRHPLKRINRVWQNHKQLIREITASWSDSLPTEAGTTIVATCFGHLADDLETFIPGESLSDKLVNAKTRGSPTEYVDPGLYLNNAVLANMFSKVSLSLDGIDPVKKALSRWNEAEMLCTQANNRIRHFRQFDHTNRPLPNRLDVHQVFHLARRKICDWLSEYEPDDFLEHTRHGPGGTGGDYGSALKRPYTLPFFKFTSLAGVTQGAYFYYIRAIAQSDAWIRAIAQSHCSSNTEPNLSAMSYENRVQLADTVVGIARGSSLGFVPKNFLTHRSVCSEPGGNIYCQLGVGAILRKALKRAGCDLSSQKRNQDLAEAGSVCWRDDTRYKVATLDMLMASDCLCVELVKELFEPKWFELMDSLRCRETKYKGVWHRLEKFSSMGNGFTFELETMVFLALSQAVSDLNGTSQYYADTFGPRYTYGELSVYGDDIIVPQTCVDQLVLVLKYTGFRTNVDKSFVDGPFRESCGKDFFHGHPVRTAYFEGDLSQTKDVIKLLNVVKSNSELLEGWGRKPLSRTLEYVRTLLSVIAPTIWHHLRSSDRTLGGSHIWCEPDEIHASALVIWDVDVQAFVQPQMRTRMNPVNLKADCGIYRNYWYFRYLQFLYANGRRGPDEEHSNDAYEAALKSNPMTLGIESGGSSGDLNVASLAGRGTLQLVHRCEAMSGLDRALVGLARC